MPSSDFVFQNSDMTPGSDLPSFNDFDSFDDTPYVHNTPVAQPILYQQNTNNQIPIFQEKKSNYNRRHIAVIIFIAALIILSFFRTSISSVIAGHISSSDVNNYRSIHADIQDQVEDKLSYNSLESSSYTASTYNEFKEALYSGLVKRHKTINITYTGADYQTIIDELKGGEESSSDTPTLDASPLMESIFTIDDPATTDDCDYLYGNLKAYQLHATSDGASVKFQLKIMWIEDGAQLEYVNKYTDLMIEELGLRDIHDKEKQISLVHDYIVSIISYDHNAVDDDDYSEHSAHKGVTQGLTVCSGYALLNYKVLTKLGIECRYVTSETHGWNIVKLNNKWYHLDLTWDDADDNNTTRLFYLKGDDKWERNSEHKTRDKYKTTSFLGNAPLSSYDYY